MDANGTRFHLFLGYEDWANCLDAQQDPLHQAWASSPVESNTSGLAWDQERNELTLQPRLFQFQAAAKDISPTLDQRRGAARDRYGNWYWVDDTQRKLLINSAGTGTTADFWPTSEPTVCEPTPRLGDFQPETAQATPGPLLLSGLTVTEEHYLVVGVLEPAGLLIFDLHAGGAPRQLFWPAAIAFVPFDMAPMPGGGVWILDRANRRYWALDRHFNVLSDEQTAITLSPAQADAFQPLGGSVHTTEARTFPTGITLAAASPLTAYDPIALEALPDCTVLILDRNPGQPFSLIERYRFGQRLGQAVSTASMVDLIEAEKRPDFHLVGHDFAFVPEHEGENGKVLDRLYIAAAEGNQTFAFTIGLQNGQLVLSPLAEYLPMRLFGGKGLVAADQQVYYDFADGWIPLVVQRRPCYVGQALCDTPIKDGREPDCVWHRLLLDACIPPETTVKIWSRAANDPRALTLDLVAWQPEPQLYLRGDGAEQPYVRTLRGERGGVWELLFQQARGRYVQLRIELQGNERLTPRLHALRIYYPRFSYLNHYLPAVYREEPQSASFLDRFLANLEGFYTTLEDKIAAMQILFDVRSAPPETLDWLAIWFDLALDPTWDEARRRLFIRHAMDFFQYRGTSRGLLMALRLTLDVCPDEAIFTEQPTRAARTSTVRIVEKYRTRQTPGVVVGDATELSGPRLVTPTARQPVQGGAELHRRYTAFLGMAGAMVSFPLRAPADPTTAQAWTQFARTMLGFVPAATAADQERWQAFLARRYQRIGALNDAYGLTPAQRFTDFAQVTLPSTLPADGAPLLDWFHFEAIVMAMQQTAHRFSVLIPLPKGASGDLQASQQALDLARRIVELEKPAHTIFDVKFYWAMFRIGAARLGEDTLLDRGSRAPELMPPMVLSQNYLAEAYLAPGHPQNVAERRVSGRDALGNPNPSRPAL